MGDHIDTTIKMNNAQFRKLSQWITLRFGIKLPEQKKTFLESRLNRRLKDLNIQNYNEYLNRIDQDSKELTHIANLVSTNKTDFFREPVHFDFLKNEILPFLNPHAFINIWSAGCSSGNEAYSIAMTIEEYNLANNVNLNYSILATDISRKVMEQGVSGIFSASAVEAIPLELKRRYFLKGKDENIGKVRVKESLRKKIRFQYLNLLENQYPANNSFEFIFCRNTMIYFDQPLQKLIVEKLHKALKHNCYFFIGHSESLLNNNTTFNQVRPTIYLKP